jgi:hypothetical protein
MAKPDVSEFLIHQRMEVIISKDAVNKHGIDDVVKAVSPGKDWTMTSYHGSSSEIVMVFINGSLEENQVSEGPSRF